MKRFVWGFMVCVAVLMPSMALAAGDGIDVITALNRDYIPAPPGTLAVLTYYKNITSDSAYQGFKKVGNPNLTANVGVLRTVYYLEAGPLVIDPQFIIPFGSTSDDGLFNDRTGIGDPEMFATFWFVHDNRSLTYVGFSPMFQVPGGEYNRVEPLSQVLSGNRYKFQEELGIVKGFCVMPGHNAFIEVHVGGVFQTDNDNATNPSTHLADTKATADIFELESHLSYDVTKTFVISGDYYYKNGGEDSFHGIDVPYSSVATSTVGGTLAYAFAPGFQALFQYAQDVSVENGAKTQAVTFRLLYATDCTSLLAQLK